MYLEKLEISGFKSFASPITLKFNRELTSIVGPNGSGKSNIADAVRWVLGEQSLKLLRGKKGEDVIFSGSDKKTRLGMAEVSLYLNNEDNGPPVDYREIVITRRIYRSGENEYLINKNKVRLVDIQLLLAQANFGQKTYSVIGQGMIDFILLASGQERKEFFDEATGIRQYQIKKEQAIHKLIATKENLSQSTNILKEIEPRYRSLSRQVRKLEKRLEFENKLRELLQLFFSKSLNDLNDELEKQQHELSGALKDREIIEKNINDIQRKISVEQQKKSREEIFNNLQDELHERLLEKNRLEKEKAITEGKSDLNLIKDGKLSLVWLNNKKGELMKQENDLEENIEKLSATLLKIENEVQEKVIRLENLTNEFKKTDLNFQSWHKENSQIMPGELAVNFEEVYFLQKDLTNNLLKAASLEDLHLLKQQANKLSEKIEKFYQKIKYFKGTSQTDNDKIKKKIEDIRSSQDLLSREIMQQKTAITLIEEKKKLFEETYKKVKEERLKIEHDEQELKTPLNHQDKQQEINVKIKFLNSQIADAEKIINEINEKIRNFNQTEDKKKVEYIKLQKDLTEEQYKLNKQNEVVSEQKIGIARTEAHLEELNKKIAEEWIGHFEPLKNKLDINLTAVGQEIERLKNQLNLIGGIDENIKSEYQEVCGRYEFLKKEIDDLNDSFASLEKVIEELDGKIKKIFNESFERINYNFLVYFKILFAGGRARLVLVKDKEAEVITENQLAGQEIDSINKEEETWLKKLNRQKVGFNIEIQATPPGKKLTNINMLSGGEKALTSIALICAIINNHPSPFVILDEVDAALDESNSIRFAKILDELTAKTQFVCITHNRATIQKAAILYGVTMGDDGVSKILSLNLKEASQYIKS